MTEAEQVTLIARSKDLRSAVTQVPADARVVSTDEELWESVARAALGRRLNLPDGDGAYDRWREQCALVELTPQFKPAGEPEPAPAVVAPQPAESDAPDAKPAKKQDDIHVDAQIDQDVFDKLVAEGKSERVARAKAKAAYVRKEKARIRAEQEPQDA